MESYRSSEEAPDGTLFAYLYNKLDDNAVDDDTLVDSARRLLETDAGKQALAQLADTDRWLIEQIGGLNVPDPQDLVDVATGQANDQQRLIVAAYVRKSVRGRNEMQLLEDALATEQEPASARWLQLPQFIAVPLQAVSSLRTGGVEGHQQAFMVAELQAQVTLRIVPPVDMQWQLEGYITQEHLPRANAEIRLMQDDAASYAAQSDNSGFFTISNLTEGCYSMQVHVEQGILVIPEINLSERE